MKKEDILKSYNTCAKENSTLDTTEPITLFLLNPNIVYLNINSSDIGANITNDKNNIKVFVFLAIFSIIF